MKAMTQENVVKQSKRFVGVGGVSAENRNYGFRPGFFDKETGEFVLSCSGDGKPCAVHQFDGLPPEWVVLRDADGHPIAIKASIVPGFVRDGHFFTREQAAQLVQWELDRAAR